MVVKSVLQEAKQIISSVDSAVASCCIGRVAMGTHNEGPAAWGVCVAGSGKQGCICYIIQRRKDTGTRGQRLDLSYWRCKAFKKFGLAFGLDLQKTMELGLIT